MMNREYMKQTYADNLTAWREYRAQIAQDAETLCEIVQNHRFNGGTPEQAEREIVQAIGKESACVIIASAVNAHEHDGRLSPEVVKWAQEIGWDWEMSCNLGLTLDGKMHMCHINQTAEALMNLPEDEPEHPETAEADETENNEQEESKMKNAEFIAQVRAILNGRKCRSAWGRGVMQYAEELTAELAENMNGGYITLEQLTTAEGRKKALLNGAENWRQYSYGGSSLIYDYDIAERLCNPSELKKTRGGERNPNSRETWLDCQARALSQASSKVLGIIRGVLYDLGMEVH